MSETAGTRRVFVIRPDRVGRRKFRGAVELTDTAFVAGRSGRPPFVRLGRDEIASAEAVRTLRGPGSTYTAPRSWVLRVEATEAAGHAVVGVVMPRAEAERWAAELEGVQTARVTNTGISRSVFAWYSA